MYGGLYTSREHGPDAFGLREIRGARTTIVPVGGGVARSDAARRYTARHDAAYNAAWPARRFSGRDAALFITTAAGAQGGNFVPARLLVARIAIQPARYHFIIPAE